MKTSHLGQPPEKGGHNLLGIKTIEEGLPFGFRIQVNDPNYKTALYFGFSDFRYNDPTGKYGVHYSASTVHGAFAEKVGHDVALRFPPATLKFVSTKELASWRVFAFKARRPLKLGNFNDGLQKLNLDGSINTCVDYKVPRAWSRWVYEHPAQLDGIFSFCRHLPKCDCFALFDRCKEVIEEIDQGVAREWANNTHTIYDVLEALGWGLVPES